MSEQELAKEMGRFEEDSKWLHNNEDNLRMKGFSSKFVAIRNKQVVASNHDVNVLIRNIEEKGENPAFLVIEFIYPKGAIVLF